MKFSFLFFNVANYLTVWFNIVTDGLYLYQYNIQVVTNYKDGTRLFHLVLYGYFKSNVYMRFMKTFYIGMLIAIDIKEGENEK